MQPVFMTARKHAEQASIVGVLKDNLCLIGREKLDELQNPQQIEIKAVDMSL